MVVLQEEHRDNFLGMSRYDVDPATGLADIAFVVQDEWQGKGVGTLLIRRMSEIARKRGIPGFTADVLATNRPMIAVFQKSGLQLRMTLSEGAYRITARFPAAGQTGEERTEPSSVE